MEPVVIYEDDHIIVVDKPSGMLVHPIAQKPGYGAGPDGTLIEWLEKRYGEVHLVHRIDRETSGVLVVARTPKVQEFLKKQFQDREVKKVYRAFVYGALKDERGIIDKPVGSARGGTAPRSARRPYGTLREAVTVYHVLAGGKGASYVEVFPQTGRTHQIRAHFAALQHPVVGDVLYAPGRAAILGFTRLALHALTLSFTHPGGKEMSFTAPLPKDFAEAEAQLRQ